MGKSYLKLLKLNAAAEVVLIPAKRNVSNNAKLSLPLRAAQGSRVKQKENLLALNKSIQVPCGVLSYYY